MITRVYWPYIIDQYQNVFVCAMFTWIAGLNEVVPTPAGASELSRLQWVPPQEVPLWDISNCCLEDGQILISPEEEVPTDNSMLFTLISNHVVITTESENAHFCVSVLANNVDSKPCQQLLVQPQHAEPCRHWHRSVYTRKANKMTRRLKCNEEKSSNTPSLTVTDISDDYCTISAEDTEEIAKCLFVAMSVRSLPLLPLCFFSSGEDSIKTVF